MEFVIKYRVVIGDEVVDTHTRGTRALRQARQYYELGVPDVKIEVYQGWARK